jgi:hypothetical protein
MSVSSSHRGSLPLPIAEAATVGYFEKATLFKGRAEIRLGDSFARQRDGVSFQAAGVTTAVRNYTIENVVLDAETLLLVQGGRVIPETAYFVPEAKRDHLKIEPAALVRLDTHEDIIMGYNNAHWGYQHWLTQCLPAIDWSLRSQRIHRCRLLLPTLAPWQEDFMGILGYGMVPRLTPRAGAQYLLPRAEYSEFLNGSTSFEICLSARDTARRVLNALPPSLPPHKVLYVPCANPYYGSISNEAEVVALLIRRGVYIVDQQRLSTADRINLFRHADVVMGPLGQGLADVVFCRPGALLWEWMPEHHQNASFNRLAQAAEVDYWGDLFESLADPAMPGQWRIDVTTLSRRLSDLSNRVASQMATTGPRRAAITAGAGQEVTVAKAPNKPIDELMLAFESLGDNCEFGLVQRRGGAEPLGLLRFAGIFLPIEVRLEKLAVALERRFEGLGAADTVAVYLAGEPGHREFMVRESAYDLMYHTGVAEGDVEPREMLEREIKRLSFLRCKLLEDLQVGEKIWVWKSAATTDAIQVQPLLEALRAQGPNTLLWVVEGDEDHPPGSIEQLDRDFIKGYIERFAPYDSAPDIRPVSWFEMCQNTYLLCHPIEGPPEPDIVQQPAAISPLNGAAQLESWDGGGPQQSDRNEVPGEPRAVHQPATMSAQNVAARFESLGGGGLQPSGWAFGCEFGYWQRSLGLEPLGLLRWASIGPTDLLRGLQTGFAGIEDESALELREHGGTDWGYTQTTYGMYMDHSGIERDNVPPDQVKKNIAKSMRFLRDKLIEDLALADKLFVYRTYDHTLDEGMQVALANALGRYGNGVLFYVQRVVDGHPAFTTVRKTRNLVVGYIDYFAASAAGFDAGLNYNPSGWEAVCRAALHVCSPDVPSQRAASAMEYLAQNQPTIQAALPVPIVPRASAVSRLWNWLGFSKP